MQPRIKVGRGRKKKTEQFCPNCDTKLLIEKINNGINTPKYDWPKVIICPNCTEELQVISN